MTLVIVSSNQIKRQKYQRCFEDYQIRKDVQQGFYNIDVKNSRINEMVHHYAMVCVKIAMLKTVTSLQHKQNRIAFRRALNIAWKERLLKSAIFETTAGIRRIAERKFGLNLTVSRKGPHDLSL